MGTAKALKLAPVAPAVAGALVKRLHYSGAVVRNSQLHLGVFWKGRLEGALQFGPSLDKRKLIGLVAETPWNGFIELNRMAFSETLPRNSESRALAVAMRLLRRHYPHLQWVVSFADATQCGDGTIYRASGFVLTGITKNTTLARLPDGRIVNKATMTTGPHILRNEGAAKVPAGAENLPGFMLRYVYFLDAAARARLSVPELPFARIREMGAAMYRGTRA